MQTQREAIEAGEDPWTEAAETFERATHMRVVVPDETCDCLACHVARMYLLPFLPVTWH